jgi:hypothetical protein
MIAVIEAEQVETIVTEKAKPFPDFRQFIDIGK